METFTTFEEAATIIDRLPQSEKFDLVNRIRQNFGFPALPHSQLLAIGGYGFTPAEMEVVNLAIAAENN
jgi:hypothetical protein